MSNRISEILESSNVSEWFWVQSHENSEDDATRYIQTPRLNSNSRWIKGPEWLLLGTWAIQLSDLKMEGGDEELINEKPLYSAFQSSTWITSCSDFLKLQRRTCWIIRFCLYLKDKSCIMKRYLQASELEEAKNFLCRLA